MPNEEGMAERDIDDGDGWQEEANAFTWGRKRALCFSVLEKRGHDWSFQYGKKTEVLGNTSVSKPQFLVDPNALKYSILHYFRKPKYSPNT